MYVQVFSLCTNADFEQFLGSDKVPPKSPLDSCFFCFLVRGRYILRKSLYTRNLFLCFFGGPRLVKKVLCENAHFEQFLGPERVPHIKSS